MSDEIEIEEHDLLDDPTVRNIFPDISRLKQEILNFEYDEAPDLSNPDATEPTSDSNFDDSNNAESSVGDEESKIPEEVQDNSQNQGQHNGFIRGDKGIEMQICNNKIIIGSKPAAISDKSKSDHFEKNIKPYCAVVALEDFGDYLKISPRYCNICNILFPTNHEYDDHTKDIHVNSMDDSESSSEENYVTEDSTEVKNVTQCEDEVKNTQQKTDKMLVQIDGDNNICLLCVRSYQSRKSLKNHMRIVHKISQQKLAEMIKKRKPGRKPHMEEGISSITESNECFHCKKSFRTQHLLIEHIYSVLQTPKTGPQKFTNKIVIGKKINNDLIHNSNKVLENKSIVEECENNTYEKTKVFRCSFCLLYFTTTKFFLRHMKIKHNMVSNFKLVMTDFDPKCKHCTRKFATVRKFNTHLLKIHRELIQEAIKKSRIVSKNDRRIVVGSKQNEKNELYRCSYCFLYFNDTKSLTRHLSYRHPAIRDPMIKKEKFDPTCKYCEGTYLNPKRYNIHFYKKHAQMYYKETKKSGKTATTTKFRQNIGSDNNITKKKTSLEAYRCIFCPLYFKSLGFFTKHITKKHKRPGTFSGEKVKFDSTCKYCHRTFDSFNQYNKHAYTYHDTLINKIVKLKKVSGNCKIKKVIMSPKNAIVSVKKKNNVGEIKTVECYTCSVCNMYFRTFKNYTRHVNVRHNMIEVPKAKKVIFNPKCKFCGHMLKTTKIYNQHIFNYHFQNIRKDKKEKKGFYRCFYCSHYFNTFNIYNSHLVRKHKVPKVIQAKIIEFDPNCKYCHSISIDVVSYNSHLSKVHKNRVNEVFSGRSKDNIHAKIAGVPIDTSKSKPQNCLIKMNNKNTNINSHIMPITISALFKCHKCDIHFSNIKTALDHSNHMEMLINWKCPQCNRIFKNNDQWLHEKQHSFSHVFTVYDLNSANVLHILYKCSKCVLHFDESVIDDHHYECSSRVPPSYVCKICDILVDCNAKIGHEYNHMHKKLTSSDFIVIETAAVFDIKYGKAKADMDNLDEQTQFETKSNNSLKRKIIITENINKLPNMSKKLKKNEDAKASQKKVKSKICNENDSNAVSLNQQRYDRLLLKLYFCPICKSFVSFIGHKRKEHSEGQCAHLLTQVCKECGLRFSCKALSTHRQVHLRIKNLQLQNFKFYHFKSGKRILPPMPEYEKCASCDVNFISKRTLGHHVCSEGDYKVCVACNIKIYKPVFNLHMTFHKYKMNDESSSSNDLVVHDKKEKTNDLVVYGKKEKNASDTNNTCEMNETAVINKSSENALNLYIYFCKVCNICVDAYDRLIEHCQRHCLDDLSTPAEECQICKLKFQEDCIKSHAKVHEKLSVPSFMKFYFDPFYFKFDNKVWLDHVFGACPENVLQDILLNSVYRYEHRFKLDIVQEGLIDLTLYKCNKCDRYVEPNVIYHHIENSCSNLRKYPCPICHLNFISLFSLTRHKSFHDDPRITLKSFRIVQFNRKKYEDLNAVMFIPPKLYVLYQCRRCDGIIDTTNRKSHVCDDDSLKSCTDCGLLITEDLYEQHICKHKTLDSFISENMKVILFGNYKINDKIINNEHSKSSYKGKIHDYLFYKCIKCNVCLKHKKSTVSHTCSYVGGRVTCSKCGLYFFSDKLLAHSKTHETDGDFVLDNMSLIEFTPLTSKPRDDKDETCQKETPLETDPENTFEIDSIENHKDDHEIAPSVSQVNVRTSSEKTQEIDLERTADIYKCSCGLHFLDESTLTEHIDDCGSKVKLAKQHCSKCGLLFTPTVLFEHLLTHHGDMKVTYKFNIVEKS